VDGFVRELPPELVARHDLDLAEVVHLCIKP
jgi:hypothetical protein